MTVPNLITSIRIILVPIFAIYLINDRRSAALVVFVVAGLSDAADGFIARLFDQKSRLGSYLDPLADKILLVTAFVVLSARHGMPAWLSVVVISRDILILLGVLILFLSETEFTIRPSVLSKATTCAQIATVFTALSRQYIPFSAGVMTYACPVTGALTIASGLHYMRYWFGIMGEDAPGGRKKDPDA